MPIFNNVISINPSRSYGLRGDAPGGKYLPLTTTGMQLGANPGGTAPWSTSFPFQNFIKQSQAWAIDSGTGTYSIDLQDNVLALTGDIVLRKNISVNSPSTLNPPSGTWTVTWDGTGEVAVGRDGALELNWTPTSGSTFTHVGGANMYLYERGGTISNIQLLPPGFVEGQTFWQPWLDFMISCNPPIVRFMDWGNTNGSYLKEWSERTLPESNGYLRSRGWTSPLYDIDNGSYRGQVPIEVMCELANILNADLHYCLPTRCSEDYATKTGQLIRQTLNPNLLVHLEYSNETWNGGFGDTQLYIGYLDATKREATGTNGSPTLGTVAHGLINGDTIVLVPHEHAEQDRGNTSITWGTAHAVSGVTTDTFDLPFNLDAGHEILYWFPTTESSASITNDRIDYNTGTRSVALWDAFELGFKDDSRVIEVIAGQGDAPSRGLARVSASGTNGRYDLYSISVYYNGTFIPGTGTQQWSYGDTITQMAAYDAGAIDVFMGQVDAQITAGLVPISAYECGSHITTYNLTGAPSDVARDAFFAEYELSPERKYNFNRLYLEMANRNFYSACQFVTDVGPFSQFGGWAIQTEYGLSPQSKYRVILDFDGFAVKQDIPPFFQPVYMLTFDGVNGSAPPYPLDSFIYGDWEQRDGKLRGIGVEPVGTSYSDSWLIGAETHMSNGIISVVINANSDAGDEAGLMARAVDSYNFFDFINLNGTARGFIIIAGAVTAIDDGGYAIPGYTNTTPYRLTMAAWGNTLWFFVDDVLAFTHTTATHNTGTVWGIKSSNGIYQTYDDLMLPHAYIDPITTATVYGSRHSMMSHVNVAPEYAPSSTYTDSLNWLPLLATEGSTTFNCPDTRFGNIENVNSIWDGLASADPFHEPWPDSWDTETYTHAIAMPPNFVQNWANDPLPNQSPADWAAHLQGYFTRIAAAGQSPELLVIYSANYARFVTGAYPIDDENLTSDEFTRWRAFARGDGADWYRDMMLESFALMPIANVRIVPFCLVFCDLVEQDFMSTTDWRDFFGGDNAPHGAETYYLLNAICYYIVTYGTVPGLSSFTLPIGHNVVTEVASNLSAIEIFMKNRLDYYQTDVASPFKGMVF